MKQRILFIAIAALNTMAQAQQSPITAPNEIGESTHAWLRAQRENNATAQPMLGATASLAYQRYLDSFSDKSAPAAQSSNGASTSNTLSTSNGASRNP